MTSDETLVAEYYELNMRIAARGILWTQGQGSNISVKSADKIWIKASGFRLDEVNREKGTVCVNAPLLKDEVCRILAAAGDENDKEREYSKVLGRSGHGEFKNYRPSMETGFHLMIPSTFVAHFHSIIGILLAVLWKDKEVQPCIEDLLLKAGFKSNALFIPQAKPGLELARYFLDGCLHDLVLIENHGIILHGQDGCGLLERWSVLESLLLESGIASVPKIPTSPAEAVLSSLEPLFPDFAVFHDQITNQAKAKPLKDKNYWVASDSLWRQVNLRELWCAQWMLMAAKPSARLLNSDLAKAFVDLPTEIARKNAGARK